MAIQAGDDILASHFNEVVPIGVVFPYAGASAPTGFVLCDGTAYARTGTYAALFAIIGTTYGAGDGATTFNVPDMRSRSIVGAGTGVFTSSFAHTAVDTSTDVITVTSNESLQTGAAVVLTTTGTLPTGLSLATTYYVIRTSATTIKLATNLANAIAGTAINITAQGSGTHTATITYTARSRGATGGEENHGLTISEMAVHTHIQDSHSHGILQNFDSNSNTGHVRSGSLSAAGTDTGPIVATTATNQNTGGSTVHNIMSPFLVLNHIIKYISYA